MKDYKCILFDLDHTLWDFEKNSEDTLRELFAHYDLAGRGISGFKYLHEVFVKVNTNLWEQHDRGYIGSDYIRNYRFHNVFTAAGLDDYPFSQKFSAHYLADLPKRKALIPHAFETLEYLHSKYAMTVVTNGFEEIQATKIASAGISHFFKNIVTSQRAGNKKPSREIFSFALAEAGHEHHHSIMVGDNLLTDIAGAIGAGIDAVYYNPGKVAHQEKITHEISTLHELTKLL